MQILRGTKRDITLMQWNEQYISRLSNLQVSILNLLIDGYKPIEIREILEISSKQYEDNLHIMRSYENVKILF